MSVIDNRIACSWKSRLIKRITVRSFTFPARIIE